MAPLLFFVVDRPPQIDIVTRRVDFPVIHACRLYEHWYRVPHLSDALNFAHQGYLAVTDLAQRQDTLLGAIRGTWQPFFRLAQEGRSPLTIASRTCDTN